jgi:hypothetical protein
MHRAGDCEDLQQLISPDWSSGPYGFGRTWAVLTKMTVTISLSPYGRADPYRYVGQKELADGVTSPRDLGCSRRDEAPTLIVIRLDAREGRWLPRAPARSCSAH